MILSVDIVDADLSDAAGIRRSSGVFSYFGLGCPCFCGVTHGITCDPSLDFRIFVSSDVKRDADCKLVLMYGQMPQRDTTIKKHAESANPACAMVGDDSFC